MAQTVLITGSSTGIGKAAAKHFRDQGWNVIATMRTPEKESELKDAGNVMLAKLDVTDADSIQAALDAGLARFGRLDAVVNNAGYGLTGTFESMTLDRIRRQFETNVFGLMAVTKAILPHFRTHKAGTVINVASMGGRLTFPLYSVYHGTKWAVDGFSESLQFELRPLGIRVKIVEPGAIKTDFYDRSVDLAHDRGLTEYNELVDKALRRMNAAGEKGAQPEIVARTIYRAATDSSWRLRYPVGSDAKSMLPLRRLLPDAAWQAMIRHALLR
jgi:NAD(P)-dependent dehydrogenase (short-subunit alcohol dehydrogenase family)